MLQAMIELIGPSGSGKSVLCQLLAKTLQPDNQRAINVLLIDACIDQGLTHQCFPKGDLGAVGPQQTLTQLVQHLIEHETRYRLKGNGPLQRQEAQQSIDWAFSNLPVSISLDEETEVDLLTIGLLTEHLPAPILQSLAYGFTRLLKNYDYVIVDGYHPLIHPFLLQDEQLLSTILVTHPSGESLLPPGFKSVKTPALVVTQFRGEPFSPSIVQALENQDVKLVGKMPVFSLAEALSPALVTQFYDCLRFMDIPLLHTHAAQ